MLCWPLLLYNLMAIPGNAAKKPIGFKMQANKRPFLDSTAKSPTTTPAGKKRHRSTPRYEPDKEEARPREVAVHWSPPNDFVLEESTFDRDASNSYPAHHATARPDMRHNAVPSIASLQDALSMNTTLSLPLFRLDASREERLGAVARTLYTCDTQSWILQYHDDMPATNASSILCSATDTLSDCDISARFDGVPMDDTATAFVNRSGGWMVALSDQGRFADGLPRYLEVRVASQQHNASDVVRNWVQVECPTLRTGNRTTVADKSKGPDETTERTMTPSSTDSEADKGPNQDAYSNETKPQLSGIRFGSCNVVILLPFSSL